MTLATLIPLVINISLFALVFALGLKTTEGDLVSLFRRPALFGRSILAMNVAMLVLATAAALILPLPIVPIAGEGRSDQEWTNGNQISLNSLGSMN